MEGAGVTNSYFIRHKNIAVRGETLDELWTQNKVAIHYPGDGKGPDSTSIEPGDYHRADKGAIRCFKELSKQGGYIWAESERQLNAKVGRVNPQEYEPSHTTWIENSDDRYQHKADSPAILKTLQLVDCKEVRPGQAMGLRAGRPRGTICRWKKCGGRLEALVKGDAPDYAWGDLSPALQEAACAEYLRLHDNPKVPTLKFLLLPVGRTLEDVDIYGLGEGGGQIYAQVTFLEREESEDKIKKLKNYGDQANRLIYFCKGPRSSEEGGVLYISVEDVLEWMNENPTYRDKMFTRESIELNVCQ